jgi:hypothetical protein
MAEPDGPFREWLATRPECVRKLATEFALGTEIECNGQLFFVIDYTEDDSLVVSPVDPSEDYDTAYKMRQYICAAHLRETRS